MDGIDDNPELTEDDKAIAAIMAELDSEDDGDIGEQDDTQEGAPSGATDEGAKQEQEPAKAEPAGDTPKDPNADLNAQNAVVMTKDGKHQMPFSVVEGLRQQRQDLESQVEQERQRATEAAAAKAVLEQQLRELQGQLAANQTPKQETVEALMSDEVRQALQDEAPALLGVFDKLIARADAAEKLARESRELIESREQSSVQERQQAVRSIIQDTIDNDPKLAYLQAQDVKQFNAIVEIDKAFLSTSIGRSMSIPDRIRASVRQYEALTGKPIEVPGSSTEQPIVPSQQTQKPAINTLSDMPGGGLPAASKAEQVAGMSGHELSAAMSRMSPDEINDLLASAL